MTTIILGIDGGCFEHIEPLLKKNLVPNFKNIIENGFSSKLQVTIPPATIPSWACSFTGMTPQQLEFCYFVHPTKGVFNSNIWRDKSIFSLLDCRMFVLNVPGTFPAWKINGEMFTGMLSPTLDTYPNHLKEKYAKDWILVGENVKQVFEAYTKKKDLFLQKMTEDFDLMVYVIKTPDSITHRSHGDPRLTMKYVYNAYIQMDEFLGKIIHDPKFENLIIFSDHGLKRYNQEFNMARWFEKKKLVYINDPKVRKLNSITLKFYDIVRPFIKRNPLMPFLRKYRKKRFKERKERKVKQQKGVEQKTRLSYFTCNVGGIFLHGKDKKKKQIIREKLEKDKNIKKVIENNIEGFPDFFIILQDKYIFGKEPSFFLKRRRETISHQELGLFIAYGRDIKHGKEEIISYQNIAPTLLKAYDQKPMAYMKGTALNIFVD